jgi:soluble lytic murein transglycosylase-like protein
MTWADACTDLGAALGVSPQVAARIEAGQPAAEAAAAAEGVDLDLVNGVIWVESKFHPAAVSSAGARGLMQLMPATERAMARDVGISGDWTEREYNVRLGTRFLRRLLKRYDGRGEWALAAYNAGPGNVDKYGPGRWLSYVRAVQRAGANFRAGRLRCRGTPLPVPEWGAKPKPRPSPPRSSPSPPPARPPTGPSGPSPIPSSDGGGVLLLGLLLWAAWEGDWF